MFHTMCGWLFTSTNTFLYFLEQLRRTSNQNTINKTTRSLWIGFKTICEINTESPPNATPPCGLGPILGLYFTDIIKWESLTDLMYVYHVLDIW